MFASNSTNALDNIVGNHRIGNMVFHISKPMAIGSGLGLASVYSWRMVEGIRAFKHDRAHPEEPKQLTASYFASQMGLEILITSIVMPIATGMLKYDGPVPIPAHLRSDALAGSLTEIYKSCSMSNTPSTQINNPNEKQSKYASFKRELRTLVRSPSGSWLSLFKIRF